MSYAMVLDYLTPEKDHTFLVRAQNGMLISSASTTTGEAHTGVNVTVEGAVHIDGQGLSSSSCTNALAGTFEVQNGCFYFCDGSYRQSFNVAFNTSDIGGTKSCNHSTRCYFDGVYLRPGDKVTGYSAPRSANCTTAQRELTC